MLDKVLNVMAVAGFVLAVGAAGQGDYEMATGVFTHNVEIVSVCAVLLMAPWLYVHRND